MQDIFPAFIIPKEFAQAPYIDCLEDVAHGMPKSIALRAHHIDDGHVFTVSELDFYYAVLRAERRAVKNLLELLDQYALDKHASKTYIWMLESIYKDQGNVSERIKKMVQENVNKARDTQAKEYVKSLAVTDAANNCNSFYDRFSAH